MYCNSLNCKAITYHCSKGFTAARLAGTLRANMPGRRPNDASEDDDASSVASSALSTEGSETPPSAR